jgi:hypothetical protein
MPRVSGRPEVFKSIFLLPQEIEEVSTGSSSYLFPISSLLNTADPIEDIAIAEFLKSDINLTNTLLLKKFAFGGPSEAEILGLRFQARCLSSSGDDSGASVDGYTVDLLPLLGSNFGSGSSLSVPKAGFSDSSSLSTVILPLESTVDFFLDLTGFTNSLGNTSFFPERVSGQNVLDGSFRLRLQITSSAQAAAEDSNVRLAGLSTSFYFFVPRDGSNRGFSEPGDRRFYDLQDDIAEHSGQGPWFK